MPQPANIISERFLAGARAAFGDNLAMTLYETAALASPAAEASGFEHLLAPGEREVLEGFRLEKRKQQWLAGRLCVKEAIGEHSRISNPASIVIQNRQDGSPYALIEGREYPRLHISISHSGELAAGLVADNHCGVDIQEERQTLMNVRQRFCSRQEDALLTRTLSQLSPLQRLNLLWCCKEAIRKMYSHLRIPGFLELHCREVNGRDDDLLSFRFSPTTHQPALSVLCSPFGGYALAVCVLKEENDA